jgi:small conductance mechanosensitive channel
MMNLLVHLLTNIATWFDKTDWLKLRRISVMMVTCVALIWATRFIHKVVNRYLKITLEVSNPEAMRRAHTLGSVFGNLTRILVVVLFLIEIIQEFSDQTLNSIFVSFGILGTILGFGLQNIVKDIVNGLVLLIENQFGVGDIISVDSKHVGTVESMTLRVTVLRDMEGRAHYISNGNISEVVVLSKDFSRAMIDIEVSQSEDIDKVISVLGELGVELAANIDAVCEPTEILGVESMTSACCVIRTLTKTLPGQQWAVARELRRRIIARFHIEGFAQPMSQKLIWHRSWDRSAGKF